MNHHLSTPFNISYRKYFIPLIIHSWKYFAILIFVALSDYENKSTVKIFQIYDKSYSLLLFLDLNTGEGVDTHHVLPSYM